MVSWEPIRSQEPTVSALVRLLYPPPVLSRSPAAVIGWWERRRVRFNLVVGMAGVVTLTAINLLNVLPPGSRGLVFFPAPILAYAFLANLFYTSGWALELAFNAWWRDDPPAVGPVLFRQGLLFSVGLTLLPIGIAALDWTFRLLRTVFG